MTGKIVNHKPRRRPFIDKIREHLVDNIPGARVPGFAAIDRWSAGHDAETPFEGGVFAMCDEVANNLDAHAAGKLGGKS